MKRALFAGMAAFALTMMGSEVVQAGDLGPAASLAGKATATSASPEVRATNSIFHLIRCDLVRHDLVDVSVVMPRPAIEYAIVTDAPTRAEIRPALNSSRLSARMRSRPG